MIDLLEYCREINEQLDQFARHLPHAQVLPLYFDDIPHPVEGFTAPSIEHMRQVLDFAREAVGDHGDATHILIHCQMGFSRSPACGLSILAATNPGSPSDTLHAQLLRIRPFVVPSPRLTRFADKILGRGDPLLPSSPPTGRR